MASYIPENANDNFDAWAERTNPKKTEGVCECGASVKAADRKYTGPCAECGAATCPAHTWFYTDESNIAISRSARPKCEAHRGTP